MEKKRNWRAIGTIALLIFSVLYAVPSIIDVDPDSWYPFKKPLKGGLDLVGGIDLRYEVVWEKAIEDVSKNAGDGVQTRVAEELAKKANLNPSELDDAKMDAFRSRIAFKVTEMNIVRVTFADQEAYDFFDEEMLVTVDDRFEISSADGLAYDLILPDDQWVAIRDSLVIETRDSIKKRVEGMGLLDPDVRVAGDSGIAVKIPGLGEDEIGLVRQHLGRPAQLRFRGVDRATPFLNDGQLTAFKAVAGDAAPSIAFNAGSGSRTGPYVRTKTRTELVRFVRWLEDQGTGIPADRMFGYELVELKDRDNTVTDRYWRTQYLESKIWLTGAQLTRAGATLNEQNQPAVSLTLNSEGAKILADVSERLAPTKDHFAIMLDDEVVSAPFFNEKIPSGRAEISMGSGTRSQAMLEARTLSDILNNGAYQAPVYEVAHNTVGPQLGADQVSAGTIALLLGLALVIAFMILYYRVSGVIAVMVLIFNMLLIIMLLVGFNSALELPGIAGIILTIGMAVDANIIIFERIREELLAGRSPRAAVDTGYAKALSAILDANITTALAGIILLNYTSGTIHNFAVTLLMGIACSVFTAVIVARMIFNYWLNSKKPSTLSI